MVKMVLFYWGPTIVLWVLPLLFTMRTWHRPWPEALERTVRWQCIASAIYLGIGAFWGPEGLIVYGFYWVISLAITGAMLYLRHAAAP